jgi:hypothetical protein
MPDETANRRVRKGTRSCIECRRRKLRCVWRADDARICLRCEKQGVQCAPQIFSRKSTSRQGEASTRDRVAALEQHVANLLEVVHDLEETIHGPSTDTHEADASSSDSGESENAQDLSGESISARPSYLNSLFNNDFISSAKSPDTCSSSGYGSSPHAVDAIRNVLLPLIPPKNELVTVVNKASTLLALIQSIFPIEIIPNTGVEMIAQYDQIGQPTVDPLVLASWLLSIAIMGEHSPRDGTNIGASRMGPREWIKFSRSVTDAVETAVVSRDWLISSVDGVETVMLLVRV